MISSKITCKITDNGSTNGASFANYHVALYYTRASVAYSKLALVNGDQEVTGIKTIEINANRINPRSTGYVSNYIHVADVLGVQKSVVLNDNDYGYDPATNTTPTNACSWFCALYNPWDSVNPTTFNCNIKWTVTYYVTFKQSLQSIT